MTNKSRADGRPREPALSEVEESGRAKLCSRPLNFPARIALPSPPPTPPAYSRSETSLPRNPPAPIRPPPGREYQLSRTTDQSCSCLRAMIVPPPLQIYADRPRKAAASRHPPAEP